MLTHAQSSCYVHKQLNNSKTASNAQACGEQVASKASTQPHYQPRTLSGAMDVHAASILVVLMLEGAKHQRPHTFKPADFRVGPRSVGDATTFRVGDGSGGLTQGGGQKAEVGSRKSEARGQRSEVRNQKAEGKTRLLWPDPGED